ncbi:MAG: caspase family protein [Bacteroidia bacterium]|nr:caspase family protein [Bacteroidia bacterium]
MFSTRVNIICLLLFLGICAHAQVGIINSGSVIRVKTQNALNSNKSEVAQVIVDQNVLDLNGNILIEMGMTVEVEVERKKSRMKGKGGKVELHFLATKAIDGQLINLTDEYKIKGVDRDFVETLFCIGCFVIPPANFLFLLIPGKNAEIPAHTVINVRVASKYKIKVEGAEMAVNTAMDQIDNYKDQTLRGGGDPLKGLNVTKAKEMKIGKYYSLVIGIDTYKGEWEELNNAVNDANAINELLTDRYKLDHSIVLLNEDATRSNIIKQLEWLVANVEKDDNVFIYYSGHGEFKNELNKGYWVPVDASSKSTAEYISNNDLQTFLGGIKSKHTLLVSDACFSGDVFRGHTVSVPFEDSDRYFNLVHNLASRQAITSGGIEPVMDGGRDGHSVFAYYLLKSLKENTNKFFDASQLYANIKIPVINNSNQSPKFQSIKNTGDEGGQFIFILKE